ncbi:hypothetical protein [Pseudonocardia acaciae]|uniref:hypothetical protein n=1 Tax=Pseudonocardia acaciae TaxID=551276 RepID=UPI0004908056|nr:hypothetical protein [Pseudonocardia acaciae]
MHPDEGAVGEDGADRTANPIAVTMSGMPEVWQGLLEAHIPDDHGRCSACNNAGTAGVPWPCTLQVIAESARGIFYASGHSGQASCHLAS